MEIAPINAGDSGIRATLRRPPAFADLPSLRELWKRYEAAAFGMCFEEFGVTLKSVGNAKNYGLLPGQVATPEQQFLFFEKLRMSDLLLARACALGKSEAWDHFLATFRSPLLRAAVAITKSDTLGHELAESLFAELYGLTTRDGERHSPLNLYMGAGSLMGWLGATLAQRFVDNHRRRHREVALEDLDGPAAESQPEISSPQLVALAKAVELAIRARDSEDRFLLAAYYLDQRRLRQIGEALNVGESTISRRLSRLTLDLRKQVLRNLQGSGMSKRGAEEMLLADPRDLDLNLKKILQGFQADTFPKRGGE